LQDVVVDQPEAAGQKNPFVSRQTIDGTARVVARHKPILQQVFFYSRKRSQDARIVGRKETD